MADVKKLREMTGAGMLDCKNALLEAGGDMEKAKEILRVKGLAKAEKKAGRETKEGLIRAAVSEDKKRGAMIEINCETDFVARNEEFQKLADSVLAHVLNSPENADREGEGTEIYSQTIEGKTLEEYIKEAIAKIGENIRLTRFVRFDGEGFVHYYIHGGGRIGVLLEFKAPSTDEKVMRVVQDVAMQIAAMRPEYVSVDSIPAEDLEKERRILLEQARQEGKPEHILEKIVQGKLRKFYQEKVLLEQAYIRDDKKTVGQMIKESGTGVEIVRFSRFELGGV
jgi:elongation factor Ts